MEVSNLPSISKDFTNKDLQNILYEIASTFNGQVQSISVTQGTAEIKFETHSQAFDFKKHYIHHKIRDRPINIHFKNKYRGGNKNNSSSDKMLEVRPAFRKLTLESPAGTRSESSITVTSEDEDPRSSRMHSKMRSKLKLKNRKKSKATEGFLKKSLINDVDSEQTSPDNNDSDDQHEDLVCEKIRDNLIQLVNNHQASVTNVTFQR